MKTHLKIGLLLSLFIFGVSIFLYYKGADIGPETDSSNFSEKYRRRHQKIQRKHELSENKSLINKQENQKQENQQQEDKRSVIKLSQLEIIKKETCKNALENFKDLGDFFDSKSELFKNPEGLVGKLDYILVELYYANTQYSKKNLEYEINPLGKKELLGMTGVMSGCSSAADVGVALASTLEAIKSGGWSQELRDKALELFMRLAKNEGSFDSWDGLSKASGILLPILIDHYPDTSELQELRSFRADILREMLTERNLIRRSLNDNDAKNIGIEGAQKRAFYREQFIRFLRLMEDLK